MGIDLIVGLYKLLVVLIYGGSAVIAILIMFFLKLYLRLDELLNLNFFTAKIISPSGIYRNVLGFDDWCITHNKITGAFLFILAGYNLIMLYNV